MPARYRIGIIGLGKMGRWHLEALQESPRWEIAWACDRDMGRLAAARNALPGLATGDMMRRP